MHEHSSWCPVASKEERCTSLENGRRGECGVAAGTEHLCKGCRSRSRPLRLHATAQLPYLLEQAECAGSSFYSHSSPWLVSAPCFGIVAAGSAGQVLAGPGLLVAVVRRAVALGQSLTWRRAGHEIAWSAAVSKRTQ